MLCRISLRISFMQPSIDKFEVKVRDQVIDLTLREFEVLKYLANQPGQVVTREALLEKVWGYEYYGDIRTVDVTIRRIREKIENDTSSPKILITKRGVGYYLSSKQKPQKSQQLMIQLLTFIIYLIKRFII